MPSMVGNSMAGLQWGLKYTSIQDSEQGFLICWIGSPRARSKGPHQGLGVVESCPTTSPIALQGKTQVRQSFFES